MLARNMLLAVGAVIAGLLLPSQAMAQYEAYTRADLNLRVGPGTNYGVIDVIPNGYRVDVLGCLDDYNWCDIEWDGLRGWVSASYLVQPGTQVYLPQIAPRMGLPIISFSFGTYHDRHYRDRPWYRERTGRWRGRRDGRSERRDRQETERPGRREDVDRRSRREEAERRSRREEAEQRSRREEAEQRSRREEAERRSRQREEAERRERREEAERRSRREEAERRGRQREGAERRDRREEAERRSRREEAERRSGRQDTERRGRSREDGQPERLEQGERGR